MLLTACPVKKDCTLNVSQIATYRTCGTKRERMADTETNHLAEDQGLESHKARRHSDIRVFSGTATPKVAEVAPEEVLPSH